MIHTIRSLLISFILLSGCAATVNKQLIGQPVSLRFTPIQGSEQIGMDTYRGKTVVISFWATTCRSSRPVITRLARYADRFKGRTDVQFVAVSLDKPEDLGELQTRIQFEDFNSFSNMFSGNEEYDEAFVALKGEAMPYIVVVDPAGRVVDARYDDGFVYDLVK